MYTLLFKSLEWVWFLNVFEKKVPSAIQGCIYLIKNVLKHCEILLQFKITVFYMSINYFFYLFLIAEFSASLL